MTGSSRANAKWDAFWLWLALSLCVVPILVAASRFLFGAEGNARYEIWWALPVAALLPLLVPRTRYVIPEASIVAFVLLLVAGAVSNPFGPIQPGNDEIDAVEVLQLKATELTSGPIVAPPNTYFTLNIVHETMVGSTGVLTTTRYPHLRYTGNAGDGVLLAVPKADFSRIIAALPDKKAAYLSIEPAPTPNLSTHIPISP